MKAKNFLHEKAMNQLSKINLETQAEELQNLYSNLKKDLPYYIRKMSFEPFSERLSAARNLANIAFVNGTIYASPKEASNLKIGYKNFVLQNEENLAKDLACSLSPIPYSELRIKKDDAYRDFLYNRKICHKAWSMASWKGKSYDKEFWDFVNSRSFPELKTRKFIPIQYSGSVFLKNANSMYRDTSGSVKPEGIFWAKVPSKELTIKKIGFGIMEFPEEEIPVFNLPVPENGACYIVAFDGDNKKHLIYFPNIDVAQLQKNLKVTSWNLYYLWTTQRTYSYLLAGKTYEGVTNIEIYGTMPFLSPRGI